MTMSLPILAISAGAIFLLGWLAGRSSSGGSDLRRPPVARTMSELGPSVRAEIEVAIAQGYKMEAIKLLREATGMGLKEARDAIEAMDRR